MTVITAGAPDALTHNGGAEALADFAGELVDHACRARLADSAARLGQARPSTPVLAALVDDAAAPDAARRPAAHTAWSQWAGSAPQDESLLVFRLFEPDDLPDPDDTFGAWDDEPAPDPRWRLQVLSLIHI